MLVNLLSHIERFINDSIFYIVFKEHKEILPCGILSKLTNVD